MDEQQIRQLISYLIKEVHLILVSSISLARCSWRRTKTSELVVAPGLCAAHLGIRIVFSVATQRQGAWLAMDFMHDAYRMAGFRAFNVIDDFNREGLRESRLMYCCFLSKPPSLLSTLLEEPKALRLDNGSEYISHQFRQWIEDRGIKLWFIQPVEPAQNAM